MQYIVENDCDAATWPLKRRPFPAGSKAFLGKRRTEVHEVQLEIPLLLRLLR